MSYWGFPKYVPVAQKRADAEKKIKQLKKKNPHIQPVVIEGNTIAKTWWGKSWNTNLERYADYANRIGRGRSYVRHGTVLDLQIKPGRVEALVQGSASKPYQVEVKIKQIPKATWENIKLNCKGKLDSLQELLTGRFPKALNTLFIEKGKGLFPSPDEIAFECNCPDWAVMCKHVAATLYGIGARLDHDPSLFFMLRKVNMDDLISLAVVSTTQDLLEKSGRKSAKIMEDADLADVFGIDLEDPLKAFSKKSEPQKTAITAKKKKPSPKKPTRQLKVTAQKISKNKKTGANQTKVKRPYTKKSLKTAPPETARASTAIQAVIDTISESPKGITPNGIAARTGLTKKQIANIIFKLKKQGQIKNLARGVYVYVEE